MLIFVTVMSNRINIAKIAVQYGIDKSSILRALGIFLESTSEDCESLKLALNLKKTEDVKVELAAAARHHFQACFSRRRCHDIHGTKEETAGPKQVTSRVAFCTPCAYRQMVTPLLLEVY